MEISDSAFSALDAIDTVAFKVGLKGYNVDEVDDFLERLSVETRQLKDQLKQQHQQLRQAAERINQLESGRPNAPASSGPTPVAPAHAARPVLSDGAEQVTSMIVMAQEFIEHAQQEAEGKARELTVAAQERAREIVTEARGRAEDEVTRLNGLKQRLSEDVETLTRQLESERTRLKDALTEFSKWVEATLHVGGPSRSATSSSPSPAPASSPAPARPLPSDEEPAARVTPPPAPPRAPAQQTIGQVLRIDPARDDRS